MKLDREFLQENGFLDDNTGKISLADKLEGKTKQYVNSHMVAKPNLTMEEFHKYLQDVIDSNLNLRQKVVAVELYIKQITGR
jgi:hypothetical protein